MNLEVDLENNRQYENPWKIILTPKSNNESNVLISIITDVKANHQKGDSLCSQVPGW